MKSIIVNVCLVLGAVVFMGGNDAHSRGLLGWENCVTSSGLTCLQMRKALKELSHQSVSLDDFDAAAPPVEPTDEDAISGYLAQAAGELPKKTTEEQLEQFNEIGREYLKLMVFARKELVARMTKGEKKPGPKNGIERAINEALSKGSYFPIEQISDQYYEKNLDHHLGVMMTEVFLKLRKKFKF